MKKNWKKIIDNEINQDYFINMQQFLDKEYQSKIIYPKRSDIFACFNYCDFDEVKVVIIGQDSYHQPYQAHGLAFSILNKQYISPSLRNIFKELEADLNIKREETNLEGWASQGVLLLNTILTVRESSPLSHKNIGWEIFTNNIIEKLSEREDKIIFVLWGNNAQKLIPLIKKHHYILKSSHPSPLGAYRSFFNSKVFSKINTILEKENLSQIDWSL